jgi:hypothetical protein
MLHFAPRQTRSLTAAVGLISLLSTGAEVDVSKLPRAANRQVDFVNDIQPILARNCYACHGDQKQEAALRWDAKEIALKGSEHGPVIVPGKSAGSLMIHLVAGLEGGDRVMPQKGDRLTGEQIGLLRAWIDQGAAWPDSASVKIVDKRQHWAFKAPVRPNAPGVKNANWIRDPVDNFVLARLEKDGLRPSPEADRVTLIRRLSLDLVGLPPTPLEVDDFVRNKSPDAYHKLVERLLASPHYGERWGRQWLDLARYADSNGYEKDAARSIWPYRDWVIKAFNDDLPFDEFTIEQLAGDLLPHATLDQRVATGFLRNSMLNQEGGIEPEQFRTEAMIDRMDAVGKTWLGLTINCCQCHNHKFDPLSQLEYYQLFAFLNNDDEPFIEVPTPAERQKRDEILATVGALEDQAMRKATNLTERMAAWEKEIAGAAGDWNVLQPKEWLNFATKYEKQNDGSLLGGGDVKPGSVMHIWVETALTNITGFRLEALMHPNLPYGGPGLVAKGSFLLKELTCEAYATQKPTATNAVKFRRAMADLEAAGFSITNAIDGDTEKGGWTAATVPVRRNAEHRAVFECAEPIAGFPGGTTLRFTLYQKHSSGDGHSGELDKDTKLDCHTLGRLRLSATTQGAEKWMAQAPAKRRADADNADSPNAFGAGDEGETAASEPPIPSEFAGFGLKADPLTAKQREILSVSADKRTQEQIHELFSVFRYSDPDFAKITRQIDDVLTNWPYAATTLALQSRVPPRETHVFKHGDWQRPAEIVAPDVPALLHAFPKGAPRNRLGLAKWLVDRRSPTTARVMVNRIWQEYFGQGLVTTPEDFGTRCETPSHPELLDWLACEFMDNGWSVKALHRIIVHSATYRQSSKVTPEILAKDPYNRLLARGPRFRVGAELVQDIALSAGGLLNPKIGGPSIRPPIPSSVGDTVYGGFSWPESTGEDRFRRGMYTFWKRSLPFPSLVAFDAPTAENSCPRRVRSNTPLQALTTLNEKTFVEAAQAMGLRVLKEGGKDDASRARFAFRLCTGRAPTDRELNAILRFRDEQYRYFEERSAAALNVAVPDLKNVPAEVNLHKVAAWAMVSRVILNLDETITKE